MSSERAAEQVPRRGAPRNDKAGALAGKLGAPCKQSTFSGSFDLRLVAPLPRAALRMTLLRECIQREASPKYLMRKKCSAGSRLQQRSRFLDSYSHAEESARSSTESRNDNPKSFDYLFRLPREVALRSVFGGRRGCSRYRQVRAGRGGAARRFVRDGRRSA